MVLRRILSLVCIGFLGNLISCGIFSPRPVEYPISTVTEDPFNFASILWNTGKKFTKLEYTDLFDPSVEYIDINGRIFYKNEIVNHLNTIQRRLTVQSIVWTKDTANPDLVISDTTYTANRTYSVVVVDTLQKAISFSDKASFKLSFNSTINAWTVTEWTDKFPGYSVFHPLFTPQ